MKRKVLSLITLVCVLLGSFSVFSFAVSEPPIDYFTVILTQRASEDAEGSAKLLSHSDIDKTVFIDSDSGEEQRRMLLVYPKNPLRVSELYNYLTSHPMIESVLPDAEKIKENVRLENELQKISYVRPYDLDADGNVTAEDARLALRAAVGLEEIPAFAVRAANYGEIYPMSSRIARRILRASVGLEHIPIFEINVATHGEQFVIGPIECHGAAGFDIKLGGDTDKFTVEQKSFGADTLAVGGPVRCYYIFTPLEEGSFKLTFTYEDIKYKVPQVVDEFTVEIHHVYGEIKEPDFIFS